MQPITGAGALRGCPRRARRGLGPPSATPATGWSPPTPGSAGSGRRSRRCWPWPRPCWWSCSTPASLGAPPTLAVLIGAIVAMLVATSVSEPSRTETLRTMAGVPLAASVGATLGVATSAQHVLGLVTFVVVSFAAVWVRRFGPRWFTYGFLAWQGFFFALFLHPPLAALPFLVGAIVVASVWVGLLLLTVLRGNPQVRLRRTVDALRARARAGISAMLEVLEDPDADAPRRRLRGQLVQLSEIALLMDGQLADPRAVPAGLRPGQVRRWAVDIEIAMDEAAAAVVDLARHKDQLPAQLAGDIRRLLRSLGWGVSEQAHHWVATLEQETRPQVPGVRRLAWAAADLLRLVEQWNTADWTTRPRTVPTAGTRSTRGRTRPPSSRSSPCSPATCRGRRRWPPARSRTARVGRGGRRPG